MKKYLIVLVGLLAMVSAVAACPPGQTCVNDPPNPCDAGTCDYNIITQTNDVDATSGQAFVDDGKYDKQGEIYGLEVDQTQKNCAAVLGEGNVVTQGNKATAYGTVINQIQDNIAMVVGSSNIVTQANDALATGVSGDGAYGAYMTQSQKNLMLVIGTNNIAYQGNLAKAYDDSRLWPAFPIDQNQKNVGLLLGNKNILTQTNDANAWMLKCIEVDPKIKEVQKNIAFAVNNCKDCKVDTSFDGATTFTWPVVNAPAPVMPAISCPSGSVCE
jgi:hypothetical protein